MENATTNEVIVILRFKREIINEEDILTSFNNIMENIMNIKLFGIDGITKVIVAEHPEERIVVDENKYRKYKKQWVVLTEGSNMKEVFTHLDNVDFTRTITNNVKETEEFLGIEAGRLQLASEFAKTLAGSYVNFRHLGLLVDVMSQKGKLYPISRVGLSKQNAGVITRASFEQTLKQFRQASAFTESDLINGVSQNILMGQRTIVGTGAFTVIIDKEELTTNGSNKSDYNNGSDNESLTLNSPSVIRVFSPKHTTTPKSYQSTPQYNTVRQSSYLQQTINGVTPSPYIQQSSPYIQKSSPYIQKY